MDPETIDLDGRTKRIRACRQPISHLVLTALLLFSTLHGCAGESAEEGPEQARSPDAGSPLGEVLTDDPGQPPLDLSAPPREGGFAEHRGSCDGFPLHLQHPAGWQISSTSSTFGTRRVEEGEETFWLRIEQDLGSTHVAAQTAMFRQGGARSVGEIEIAGRRVEVLGGAPDSYHLFVPHPWGGGLVGYYSMAAQSSLGDEETLRILDSLVPVGGCVE